MKKILLVSHEALTRILMRTLIEEASGNSVEVIECRSCSEAVCRIREEKVDLVITDCKTGSDTTTGFDVVREVHSTLHGQAIIAAHRLSEEEQELAKLVRPDGFLQQPFDPRLFQYIVGSILNP